MKLTVLSSEDVRKALPMAEAIEAVRSAFIQLSRCEASVPLRTHIDVPRHSGTALVMPAHLQGTGDLAIKLVGVYPRNAERSLPTIHAIVVALDETTGAPLAVLEGAALTAIRTGAASGAATDLLARPDAHTAAIIGAGVQGRTQLEAVCTVRTIRSVWVYDQDPGRAEAFCREMAGRGPIPERLQVAASPYQAVADADILCTATTSSTPVFRDEDVRPGTHINAVGAFTPSMCEIPASTVSRSLIVVDSREAVLAEAGDLIQAIQAGVITAEDFHAELGEIAAGGRPGRTDPIQITLFKSVGVAVQDAAAAARALAGAKASGLGRTLDL